VQIVLDWKGHDIFETVKDMTAETVRDMFELNRFHLLEEGAKLPVMPPGI